MQNSHQFLTTDEEETLVAPRFDDEETVVARRVVPFGEVGQSEPVETPTETVAPALPPEPPARRRSWPLSLAVASALVGAALGGSGLYLYQSRASSHADNATTVRQPVAPSDAPDASSQPTPAPTLEVVNEQPSAPAASQNSDVRTDESDASAPADANAEEREAPKDAAASPEAEQRKADERAGSPRHGKKGNRDAEIERDERRARRSDSDDQLSRSDADTDNAPVARHVDTIIFNRPRRAERRDRTRNSGADRVRRIFEGQPQ